MSILEKLELKYSVGIRRDFNEWLNDLYDRYCLECVSEKKLLKQEEAISVMFSAIVGPTGIHNRLCNADLNIICIP